MTLRDDASSIYKSCIKNLNPSSRVYDYLKDNNFFEKDFESLFVVSFGKASIGAHSNTSKYLLKKENDYLFIFTQLLGSKFNFK